MDSMMAFGVGTVLIITVLVTIVWGQVFRIRILEDDRVLERKRADLLLDQVSALAQQLATIRVQYPGSAPDENRFEPPVDPPKPYSQKLYDFLMGIEFEDSRLLVEEDIERLRAEGIDDEQIYEKVSMGDIQ